MHEDNKKIITVSFVIVALLTGFVVDIFFEALSATWGFLARFYAQDIVSHGIPVAIGLITFLILQFNKRIMGWAEEVVVEIKKVVWPSRQQTVASTIAVCFVLVLSGILLGIFDYLSLHFISYLVGF